MEGSLQLPLPQPHLRQHLQGGYGSAFSPAQLAEAGRQGLIDQQVIALGGITSQRFAQLKAWGFGGAALLGDIWNQPQEQFLTHFMETRKEAER